MANTNIFSMTDSWNNVAVIFNAIQMDVADIASDPTSNLFNLKLNGASLFSVGKNGNVKLNALTALVSGAGNAGFVQFSSSSGVVSFGGKAGYANGSGGWSGWQIASDTPMGFSSSPSLSAANDAMFWRDGAGIIAQQNGINAQIFRVYNTFTDASNYRRIVFDLNATSASIRTEGAGTGAVGLPLELRTVGANVINFATSNSIRWALDASGNLGPFIDNSFDMGSTGGRIRNLFVAGYEVTGSKTVATLPAAATAGANARMFVTDASAPAFGATVVGGGTVLTPVYSDGTNWKVG